ncbi:beta-galactosidase [Paenibacillus sp. PL91]|uniref:beta-galactosidase n=1 Tax=Paenibacillus sp. PL91 TaxID=2729538 RepID=UPI00145C40ED|nr:beta-galactosidase [Paenibacillus sp. PL91]MBC9198739.1 beta-galactosidase [Paenibacillus sp. PL91]
MKMGVDYYPEHWEQTMWEQDAKLMRETGVSLVRVAEFAWSRLEPEEGGYDFSWLDEAIDVFDRQGIKVVIGTPTCTPPNWLVNRFSDVIPVDAVLHPRYPGIRGHRCYNSPSMRLFSERIVEKLAMHYSNHPAVISWQIDNEFSLNECHCESCNQQFRRWLSDKYGSLDAINEAWGTVVWSGEYSSWDQITTPLGGTAYKNPSYLLDYKRFETDSVVEFQQLQGNILRQYCPGHFVTHNIWSYPMSLDYYKLCKRLDFASLDYYPNTSPEKAVSSGYSGALTLDLTRGIKRSPFWIMETISGPPGCWFPMWRTPQPGFIRAYAWQCIARGADTLVHFRWRSAPFGAEQFWHGLIDHSNVPGRRFEEYRMLCDEVNRLSPVLAGSEVLGEAAVLHSHDLYNAFAIQPQAEGMDYFDNLKLYHRALTKSGILTDVVNTTDDLDRYRLIIAPSLYLLDENLADKLKNCVKNGAILILTNRTGVKNLNNVCWIHPLPGQLAEAAGVTVTEYDPVGNDVHTIRMTDGKTHTCSQWCDILEPAGAETIAWYENDFFAGKPAVTVHAWGEGKVYYIGTVAEESFYLDLFGKAADEAGLTRFTGLPEGVQISIRRKGTARYLFVLNLTRKKQTVKLGGAYLSLLREESVGPAIDLDPYAVEIVKLVEDDVFCIK